MSAVSAPPVPLPGGDRLMSLDAYRGFILFLLASAGFGTVQLAHTLPESPWAVLGRQFVPTAWEWGAFWDLIMPAFMFMVGVAMPLSFARRQRAGEPWSRQLRQAVVRALVLIGLGMVLMGQPARFLNVLTQIGLGYGLVFLLLNQPFRTQLTVHIMTLLWPAWIVKVLKTQFGSQLFTGPYGPVGEKLGVLGLLGLFCAWLHRRRLFFRI